MIISNGVTDEVIGVVSTSGDFVFWRSSFRAVGLCGSYRDSAVVSDGLTIVNNSLIVVGRGQAVVSEISN